MAITSFMENLRKPKSLGRWAPTGEIRAGESDPYLWAKDLVERDNESEDMAPMRRGNMGRVGARMSNPDWMDTVTNLNSAPKMDVVYNQQPEMFDKQLKFQKDQAAQRQKNIESDRIVDAMAANDEYIDKRRQNEMRQKQVETQDWAARNLKPGEMGDRERMQADFNQRHALETAKSINDWVKQREASAGAERVANIRGESAGETAATRAAASTEAANIRAAAMEEAARIRAAASGGEAIEAPVAPTEREIFEKNKTELESLINAPDAVRLPQARKTFGASNVPLVAGVGSAALGGQPSSPGLRGNAPIDANATTRPGSPLMRKTQRNAKTGATRTLVSRDGGKTWQPE
jgi:hypothetical protein